MPRACRAGRAAASGDAALGGHGDEGVSRLLVVEDDPDIALALRMLFSRAGYEVAQAGDGRTGLKEAYAEHPDLVVLDVACPRWTAGRCSNASATSPMCRCSCSPHTVRRPRRSAACAAGRTTT